MKSIISIIISIILICVVIYADSISSPCSPYGDVDNDGYLTDSDVDLIGNYGVGNINLTANQKSRADVSEDGKVDIVDAMMISQYITGGRTTFPVCGNQTANCTDTDWFGGDLNKRLIAKGTCIDSNGTYIDVCSGDLLKDYYCTQTSNCDYESYDCKAYGFDKCKNGVCINETPAQCDYTSCESCVSDNTCKFCTNKSDPTDTMCVPINNFVSMIYTCITDINSCPSQPKPDLTITDIYYEPNNPKVGEEVKFKVTVKNIGLANAFLGYVNLGIPGIGYNQSIAKFGFMLSNQSSIYDFGSFPVSFSSAGTYDIRAMVDPNNQVDESDEFNNNRTETLIVAQTNLSCNYTSCESCVSDNTCKFCTNKNYPNNTICISKNTFVNIRIYDCTTNITDCINENQSQCPDGICSQNENCPADASACQDNVCYEPTCLNGCGETPIINAEDAGECDSTNAAGSCISAPCTCNAQSECVSSSSPEMNVLIVALKKNLEVVYSPAQITQLENKIKDFQESIRNDNLKPKFLYLDEDETSDLIGSKVTNTDNWNNLDAVLDQLILKLNSSYLIIIGGYDRFVQAPIGSLEGSDDPYGDINGDMIPDIPVGRIPDPNNGDLEVILNALDTSVNLHNSGGVDLSDYAAPILGCGGWDTFPFWKRNWSSGRCFCFAVWGDSCSPCGNCCGCIDPPSIKGKNFVMIMAHGPGASHCDLLLGGCFKPGDGTTSCSSHDNCFGPNEIQNTDISKSVWMSMSCGGGHLKQKNLTSGSIAMTFLKKGGAIYLGNTDMVYGGTGNNCPVPGGDCCIGSLYTEIATRFGVGKRIGDAYKEGKVAYTDYPAKYNCSCKGGHEYTYNINCLYGDPTLKIKKIW